MWWCGGKPWNMKKFCRTRRIKHILQCILVFFFFALSKNSKMEKKNNFNFTPSEEGFIIFYSAKDLISLPFCLILSNNMQCMGTPFQVTPPI